MDKVYLISYGAYYDWSEKGFFLTQNEAEQFCESNNKELERQYTEENPYEDANEHYFIPYEHYTYRELNLIK